MRFLTVIFFTLAGLSLSAQSLRFSYHDGDSSKVKEAYFVDLETNHLEGQYISYFLNGKKESEGAFESNLPVGEWKFFYETGYLKMKMNVVSKEVGDWEYFYENGNRSMDGRIVDKHRQGKWHLYYESGELKSTGNFLDNKMAGPWQFFYEDGKLKGDITYDANKGQYKEYFPSGEVKAEGPKSGLRNTGRWKYYFKDGQGSNNFFVEAEGNYINGRKTGEWTYYFLNGKVSAKGSYLNDKPEGKWEHYYEDGSISSSGDYAEGLKNGTWDLFYPDGKKRGNGEFISGNGEYTEYYRDQKIKIKGPVRDGKNHGTWKYYYPSGKLEGECEFAHGRGTYMGYYPDGTLQTKGVIQDDKKIGTWELYENDGTLSGYYKPFYDENEVSSKVRNLRPSSPRKLATTHYRGRNRGFRYFDSRINEFHGIILSTNPLMTFVGKIPVSAEFYVQERIGHEFEFEGIRKPFFALDDNIPLDQVYSRGYNISIRQKFYNKKKPGLWYFGHEIRFSNLAHNSNVILPILPDTPLKVTASEQRVQYHILTGYRLMESFSRKGFTLDMFGGVGVGYRNFNVDEEYSESFIDLPKNTIPISFRLGFSFGYTMAYDQWD